LSLRNHTGDLFYDSCHTRTLPGSILTCSRVKFKIWLELQKETKLKTQRGCKVLCAVIAGVAAREGS